MAKLAVKTAVGFIPANLQTLHVLHHCTSHDTCNLSTPSGFDVQLDFGSDDNSAEGSVMDHEGIGEPLYPTSTEPGSDPCHANGICESGHGESNSESDPPSAKFKKMLSCFGLNMFYLETLETLDLILSLVLSHLVSSS